MGQAFWVALPLTQNTTSKPIELVGVKVLDVPAGLEVTRYAAFSSEETDGIKLLFPDGSQEFPTWKFKDYSKSPIKLAPKEFSYFYYSARVVVTGEVEGEASRCRYAYRQGGVNYTQDLPCRFSITLEGSE
ncbi:hypothetical protein ACGF1Z_22605 [Streptomyces sp. NPDC048018]|uniref:hypothetical protein n=1 Tax=Streptomyces sp. NPDC048018 TaxID=3365499 RepID=UPI00371A212F